MVVIQPAASGGNPLPYTKVELERIKEHVPSDFLHILGVGDAPATVQNVLSHLSTSQIVHFACHGRQNASSPLDSSLVLHNGNLLTVSAIMKQQMPNASLAFLCACETAMGTEDLPDEAMHLAASLLFAGFRGVVATMWYVISSAFLQPLPTGNTTGLSLMKMALRSPRAFMSTSSGGLKYYTLTPKQLMLL
jgi:CHAT domain-containing protein